MATKNRVVSKSSSSSSSLIPWLGIAAIVILFDQITKITVLRTFRYAEELAITSFFNLVLAFNKGAAFSFLSDQGGWQRYFFTAIALGAAGFILYLLKKHAGQRMFCWALALILGGALGNAIDRLVYGHVVDFLDFHWKSWGHFPAFNIADTAICIGAALFIIDELRRVNKK
ncbi:signal peptidase II [Janthinobacterium aquaticum]|uniref:signal peptidase II n=1 Tax=Janthinobacterium sp. FT58W TaxID=2654254 RepID=UPI001264B65B|nr:signal peptidase II [Janthinobacterium sp. FT58W]KAB8043527.1 lipoprotein signal peptidase [Janthinobacterium sp. FT58W]